MKRLLLLIGMVLIWATPALAQDAWHRATPEDGTAETDVETACIPNETLTLTATGATSVVLDTRPCPSITIDAANLTGASIVPVKCNDLACSNPMNIGASPLADGDYWIIDYDHHLMRFLQITGMTAGDIVEVVGGRKN